MTQDDYKTSES